jgi:arabinogalactan oligomer/maltooligosaccharide transport system substrate-binding protein
MKNSSFRVVIILMLMFACCLSLFDSITTPAQAKQDTPGAVTITIWHSDPTSALDTIVHDFQVANPTITVQLVYFSDPGELSRQYLLEAPLGGGPDLVHGPNDWLGIFAAENLIQPVDPSFDLSLFVPQTQAAVRYNQKNWAIPATYGNQLMLFYNKNLVASIPANTDAWITLAKTLTSGSQYGLVYNVNEPFWLIPWLTGNGGWVFDETLTPPVPDLGSPEMVAALQFVHDLRYVEGILPLGTLDYGLADTMFKNGEAAMIINGDWALSDYLSVFGSDLGIAMIPMISDTSLWPQPMTSGKFYYFNANISILELDASKLFVQFASTKTEQLVWADVNILPALQAAFDDPAVQTDPILQASADQAAIGRLMPVAPEMACVWEAIFEPLATVMENTATAGDAASAMQSSALACTQLLHLNKYWTQSNRDGYNDPENQQIPSLEVFGDYLYAGVWNGGDVVEAQIWRTYSGAAWELVDQRPVSGASYLQAFNGFLYAGSWDGKIWRSANGTDWGLELIIPGYDPAQNGVARMDVFNGKLYLGTWKQPGGQLIWRTSTGLDWAPFAVGIGDDANNTGATSSAVFNNMLYFGVANWTTGAELWRTDGTTWSLIKENGFGNADNRAISSLAVYRGYLYAGMFNGTSVQVWRSDDGVNWTQVVYGNIGPTLPEGSNALEVYNGTLYLVTGQDSEGLQVWSTRNGTSWIQVAFAGFGDPANGWSFWDSATEVFKDKLYVGTNNFDTGGEIWKYDPLSNKARCPVVFR